jgi:hypothetical protein
MANRRRLLPCPFCGGKAKFAKTKESFETCDGRVIHTYHCEVHCTKCFAQTCSVMGGDPDKVKAVWNRRVGDNKPRKAGAK